MQRNTMTICAVIVGIVAGMMFCGAFAISDIQAAAQPDTQVTQLMAELGQ